jgi:bacterioferritin (cytochrome b1)
MTRYLIVAHQTATSNELTEAIQDLRFENVDAEFVLLVPETPVEDLLDWEEGDSKTIAQRTADAAKAHLEESGAVIVRAEVTSPSPLRAIDDELAKASEPYEAIVISTLPLQRSRWLALDLPRRVERRFGLRVIHVVGHSVTMTREQLIAGLNEDLNLELESLLRSVYHAAMARGMLGHELRELLKKELASELDHAMFLADKIVALGGEVEVCPSLPRKISASRDLLQDNIAGESRTIANYKKRIDQAAEFGDRGLVIRLEEILAAETDHFEDLQRLSR